MARAAKKTRAPRKRAVPPALAGEMAARASGDAADLDRALGFSGVLPHSVTGLFRFMGIADEEIDRAKAENPALADKIHRSAFSVLAPGGLRPFGEKLYRAHCREMIARVAADEDTRPGSMAEALAAMCETSLVAPPRQQLAACYEQVFARVMGAPLAGDVGIAREPWGGATEEMIATLRRKLAVAGRVVSR